jgi:hypothetical protein
MIDVHRQVLPPDRAEPSWPSADTSAYPALSPLTNDWGQTNRSAAARLECRPSRAAMSWLRTLPEPLQPVRLMHDHARVANLLCHRWDDNELALRFLKELLNDSRGGRNGFAPVVADELRALAEHLQRQLHLRH